MCDAAGAVEPEIAIRGLDDSGDAAEPNGGVNRLETLAVENHDTRFAADPHARAAHEHGGDGA